MPRKPKDQKKTFNWKSKIRSAARKIWMWSPMRAEALRNATKVRGFVDCAQCGKRMKKVPNDPPYAIDHIVPASEVAAQIHSFDDWFERLYRPSNELQLLCKDPCHAEKTQKENSQRRSTKSLGKLSPTKKAHSKRS